MSSKVNGCSGIDPLESLSSSSVEDPFPLSPEHVDLIWMVGPSPFDDQLGPTLCGHATARAVRNIPINDHGLSTDIEEPCSFGSLPIICFIGLLW